MKGWQRRPRRLLAARTAAMMLAVVVGLTLSAPPIMAGDPTEAVQITATRQGEMLRMAAAMRVLGGFLKGDGTTAADVGTSARLIQETARTLTRGLFPEGTAQGVGASAASPEIWRQWDIFVERAGVLTVDAGRLATVAASGDSAAMRAPIAEVVRSCSACHELFRLRKP